ncbi:hypothetical protein [Microvirga yunnanensis]|uniref:hypothetical protein n=1 Tax=Microvirga yunnanensis TaxID=2953740 RepID=UPI0021C92B28|nr:hypothetical protein [Microvirga sp. HBU65207]
MPESREPGTPSSLSHSETSRRSFDKAVDDATQAIEQARAQIARSKSLGQSEAAQSQEIDRLSSEHERFARGEKDRP